MPPFVAALHENAFSSSARFVDRVIPRSGRWPPASRLLRCGNFRRVLIAALSTTVSTTTAPSTSPPTTAPTAPKSVPVTEVEFKIELPSTTLSTGSYTFDLMNKGAIAHDLVFNGPGVSNEKTPVIGPGKTA